MRYKFRAECWVDVDFFIGVSYSKIVSIDSIYKTFPDIEIVVDSDLSLNELIDEMREVPDGHVMYQTLQLEDNYTGQRNYEL